MVSSQRASQHPADRPLVAIDATFVPPLPAGAGMYAINLIRALSRRDDGLDYVVYVRRHTRPLLELETGSTGRCQVVDVGDQPRWRRYLWEQVELPADLRRRRVDLLHSPHHSTPLLYSPCPRVLTIHDVTFFLLPERYPRGRRWFFQAMTWMAARRADRVIVPSAAVQQDVNRVLGLAREKAKVTHEGVDPAFQPLDGEASARLARERYGLPDGYLLSLGTREPGKNREAMIRALRLLIDQGRDLHLAVVGQPGWGAAQEVEVLRRQGLADRVHFTGYVPQTDLPALYNAARIFVFPSLYEGFGLPALEALACGVPVVTANVSALPEVVGEAALTVDPSDPEAIAAAIARILDDDGLADSLRRAGPERAHRFTWDACAAATVAAYRSVLGLGGADAS